MLDQKKHLINSVVTKFHPDYRNPIPGETGLVSPLFGKKIERNQVFATNSDSLIPISSQPNVVDL